MKPLFSLEHYYQPKNSLRDDFDALSNPSLNFQADRQEVNERVLNFVLKYAGRYLDISLDTLKDVRLRLMEVLEQELVKGEGDSLALQCLGDFGKTAAIFKEIAFHDGFKKEEPFLGIDFGSGSGILMPAIAIAAKRQGIDPKILGIEKEVKCIENAKRVLNGELDLNVDFKRTDLSIPSNIKEVLEAQAQHLRFWVSETIAGGSPILNPDKPNAGVTQKLIRSRILDRIHNRPGDPDPFPEVIYGTLQAIPDFKERIKRGEIAMFPDLFNGLYDPRSSIFRSPTLQLKTGKNHPHNLNFVEYEFRPFEIPEMFVGRW